MLTEGLCEGGRVSLYLIFIIIILHNILLIWILGKAISGAEVWGSFPQ